MNKKFTSEFAEFLKEYQVISLAIAFIMGQASTGLVDSLVKDIFLPLLAPLMSSGSWQTAVVHIGPVALAYGPFLAELLNFLIVALIVFLVAKKLMKIGKAGK